jgi:hypothetical protein
MCHASCTSWNNETDGECDDQNGTTTESYLITRISTDEDMYITEEEDSKRSQKTEMTTQKSNNISTLLHTSFILIIFAYINLFLR